MSSLWAIQGTVGCGQRKKPCNAVVARLFYAQMERFELSHRLSQSTPLAGEPLEPLGYICRPSTCFSRDVAVQLRLRLRTRAAGEIRLSPAMRLRQSWRRERDSNPRCLSTSLVFKTSALNRSAISPCITSRDYHNTALRIRQALKRWNLLFPCRRIVKLDGCPCAARKRCAIMPT